MAAIYLGGVTVGGAIPGAAAKLSLLADGLRALRVTADAQLQKIADASAAISAQAQACADAKLAIRIPATIDFQAQLDAALEIGLGLNVSLTNPALYMQGLLDGLLEVQANLSVLVPTVALDAQVSANVAVAADFGLKIGAVDLQLQALVAITAALGLVVSALLAIQVALTAALNLALGVLSAYASFSPLLGAAGLHAFLYDGPLSGIGAAIDAIAAGSSGISGAANVRVPLVVVDTVASPGGLAGVNAVFKVS